MALQGRPAAEAIRSIGATEVTYYRWRQEYDGLKGGQMERLKELEADKPPTSARYLRSDLDKMIPG